MPYLLLYVTLTLKHRVERMSVEVHYSDNLCPFEKIPGGIRSQVKHHLHKKQQSDTRK